MRFRRRGRRARARSGDRHLLLENLPEWVREHIARQDAAAGKTKPKKPAKYRNRKVLVDGIMFDSKREAARYKDLKTLFAAGKIRDLVHQPRFELHAAGADGEPALVGRFTPDFSYWDVEENRRVVEDVKSKPTRTTAYMLRKRMFEAEYGIELKEVF